MRRTRHIMLPVRSWQYIGFLIVSLACLTLGVVARDREGRAGSLAGPELQHTAPHEVDACPNSNPFTDVSSCLKIQKTSTGIQNADSDPSKVMSTARRISRSRSFDQTSRQRDTERRVQSRIDLRDTRRIAREMSNRENEYRTRRTLDTTSRSRQERATRRSSDPMTRVTQRISSTDSRTGASRSLQRESREPDYRRSSLERRINREVLNRRSAESRDRVDIRERKSQSLERRNTPNRELREKRSLATPERSRFDFRRSTITRENRETINSRRSLERVNDLRARSQDRTERSELRERRVRSMERRDLNRVDRREATREDGREDRRNLLNRVSSDRRSRSTDRFDDRRSMMSDSRRQDERREDLRRQYSRRVSRVALDERRSLQRLASSGNRVDRMEMNRREHSRKDEESRREIRRTTSSMERLHSRRTLESNRNVDRVKNRERVVRSMERRVNERIDNNRERRLADRSVNADNRREASRIIELPERSADRVSRVDSRHERMNANRRTTVEQRDRRVLSTMRRTSRIDADRRSLVRLEKRDVLDQERRDRVNRVDRRLANIASERREASLRRDLGSLATSSDRRQDTAAGRRERVVRSTVLNRRDSRARNVREAESSRREEDLRRVKRMTDNERRLDRRSFISSRLSTSLDRRSSLVGSIRRMEDHRSSRLEISRRNLDSRRLIRDTPARSLDDIRAARKDEERRFSTRTNDMRRTRSVDLGFLNSRTFARTDEYRNADNALTRSLKARLIDAREKLTERISRTRNLESRMTNGIFLKQNTSNFDVLRQALVVVLCSVYGYSLLNRKGSYFSNLMKQAPRYIIR